MTKILVVDDDAHIRDVICFALEKAGYDFAIAKDGKAALAQVIDYHPDLVILDIGLPELDGLEVCKAIRKTAETPILFLSARSEEIDRIIGLEIGGDDYVTKPFSPRELVARVGVILKRVIQDSDQKGTEAYSAEAMGESVLQQGELSLHPRQYLVRLEQQEIELTMLEFNILKTLLQRPKIVFTRGQILDVAYTGNIHVSDRTIDSHIRNIRGKFKKHNCDHVIETVHGVGFRLGSCVINA